MRVDGSGAAVPAVPPPDLIRLNDGEFHFVRVREKLSETVGFRRGVVVEESDVVTAAGVGVAHAGLRDGLNSDVCEARGELVFAVRGGDDGADAARHRISGLTRVNRCDPRLILRPAVLAARKSFIKGPMMFELRWNGVRSA